MTQSAIAMLVVTSGACIAYLAVVSDQVHRLLCRLVQKQYSATWFLRPRHLMRMGGQDWWILARHARLDFDATIALLFWAFVLIAWSFAYADGSAALLFQR